MNKELEETAVRKYGTSIYEYEQIDAFIDGAKYMQEKMFSEEDMRKAIIFGLDGMFGFEWGKQGQTENQINKYLKQLKKK